MCLCESEVSKVVKEILHNEAHYAHYEAMMTIPNFSKDNTRIIYTKKSKFFKIEHVRYNLNGMRGKSNVRYHLIFIEH
jgi:UPF0288 family protein (methanogenesis marker protein 3)